MPLHPVYVEEYHVDTFLLGMVQGKRELLEKIGRLPGNLERYSKMLKEGSDPKNIAVMLELEKELIDIVAGDK